MRKYIILVVGPVLPEFYRGRCITVALSGLDFAKEMMAEIAREFQQAGENFRSRDLRPKRQKSPKQSRVLGSLQSGHIETGF